MFNSHFDNVSIDILYQLIGIIAMILSFLSFQKKKNKTFLIYQCISCGLFSVQFFLIRAAAASIMNALCIIRCIFYAINQNKKRDIVFTFVISLLFISAGLISIFVFKENFIISIICMTASIVSSIGVSTKNNKTIRLLQVCYVSPAFIVNGVFYFSIGGIIAESLNFISALIALINNRKKQNV